MRPLSVESAASGKYEKHVHVAASSSNSGMRLGAM
jgi:hypothetical protein